MTRVDPLLEYLSPADRATHIAQRRRFTPRISAAVRRRDFVAALHLMSNHRGLDAILRWLPKYGPEGLREAMASAWTGAEPDDTDPLWLDLWLAVAAGQIIESQGHLPDGALLTVHRGQARVAAAPGIAWSLREDVARWFAVRPPAGPDGVVLVGQVRRDRVLAFINNRNEAEVIVDPDDVELTQEIEVVGPQPRYGSDQEEPA